MSGLFTNRRLIADEIKKGLVSAIDFYGIDRVNDRNLRQLTAQRTIAKNGKCLKFTGSEVAECREIKVSADKFTTITTIQPNFSSASNNRQGIFHYQVTPEVIGDRLRLIWLDASNGFYLDSNFGFAYSCKPTFSAGDVLSIAIVKNGTSVQYYINGVAASTTTIVSTIAGVPSGLAPTWLGSDIEQSGRVFNGNIYQHLYYNRNLSYKELLTQYKSPLKIFELEPVPFYFNTSTSGSLTGDNSNQSNASNSASIAQTHVTTGGNASQANSSSAASVSQTHVINGAASNQQNTSSAAAIIAAGALTGANSDQANSSSAANVSQTHITAGANATQNNASSVAAIIADGSIVLTGANSNQANVSGSAAISQTHIITGSHANQINTSTSAAVNAVYDHLRIAAFSLRLARQAAFQLPINRSMQRSANITRQLAVPLTLDCHTD